MKNKGFWITAAILAIVIIIVVIVIKLGGKKLKIKDSAKKNRIWLYTLDNGKAEPKQYYDGILEYVIVPYRYSERDLPFDEVSAAGIPVKGVVFRSPSGKIQRSYLPSGFYIMKNNLEIQ